MAEFVEPADNINQELLDSYYKPPQAVDQRAIRLAAWVSGPDEPYINPNPGEAVVSMADKARLGEANAIFAAPESGSAERIVQIANKQGKEGGPEATVGMAMTLAEAGGEPVPSEVANLKAWSERSTRAIDYFKKTVDRLDAETLDAYETDYFSNPTLNAISSAVAQGLDLAKTVPASLFIPDAQYAVIKVAQSAFPEETDWTELFKKRETFAKFRDKLFSLPEAEAQKVIDNVVNEASVRSGFNEPNLPVRNLLVKQIFNSLTEGVSRFDNVTHALAYLGPVDLAVQTANVGLKALTGGLNAAAGALRESGSVGQAGKAASVAGKALVGASKAAVDALGYRGVTPAIALGSTADAATLTQRGAQDALSLVVAGDEAALAARGTSSADVVGSLLTPKLFLENDELGRPAISAFAIGADAIDATKTQVSAALTEGLALRLKDTVFHEVAEDGVRYTASLGRANGRGYTSFDSASQAGLNQFGEGNFSVLSNGGTAGQFFLQVTGRASPSLASIRGPVDWVKDGAWAKKWLGVESAYTDAFQTLRAHADRLTNLGTAAAREQLPFLKDSLIPGKALPSWKLQKLYALIDKGDRQRKVFTQIEAEAELGDAALATNYIQFVKFNDKYHASLEYGVYNSLVTRGFERADIVGVSQPVKQLQQVKPTDNLVDAISGALVKTRKPGDTYFELLTPVSGSNIAVLRAGQSVNKTRLTPQGLLHKVPGYVNRSNTYSHFIVDKRTGDVLRGASSSLQANSGLASLVRADPALFGQVEVRVATQVQKQETSADIISSLKEQGLFRHQTARGLDVIVGVDGKERVSTVVEGLESMIRRYGDSQGISRWSDYALLEANRLIAHIPGASVGIGRRSLEADKLNEANRLLYNKASIIADHVETINGVNKVQLNASLQSLLTRTGEAILDLGSRYENVGAGQFTSKVNPIARAIGNTLSGVDDSPIQAARKVAFYSLLAFNIFRNFLTQTSLFWHYPAVRGGTQYLLSGEHTKDALLLAHAVLAGKGATPRGAQLYDLWVRSGLGEGVKGHPAVFGVVGTGRADTNNPLVRVTEQVARAARNLSYNAPVALDKMQALLFSAKRWSVDTGKAFPVADNEVSEVVKFAEKLSLNQNRTGALSIERGTLGVATQFLGHQIKMTARIANIEKGFTVEERARMVAYQLGAYGLAGLGISEAIDYAESKTDVKWDARVKAAVHEGFVGAALNIALQGGATAEDQYTDFVSASGSISPVNFLNPYGPGGGLASVARLVDAVATGGLSAVLDSPASGVVGKFAQAVSFGKFIALEVDAPYDAKLAAIAIEAARVFPLTNNLLKATTIFEHGVIYDRQGKPLTEATNNGWVAALAGLPTYQEQEVRELRAMLYPEYSKQTESGLIGAVQQQAKENASKIARLLEQTEDNETDKANLIYGHAVLMKGALGPAEVNAYRVALVNELRKQGTLGTERGAEQVLAAFRQGTLRPTQEVLDELGRNNVPGVAEARQFVLEQQEVGRWADTLLEEAQDGR